MESTENTMPKVETIPPEAPSSYQLALRTDDTNRTGNPIGVSPVNVGMSSSLAKKKRGRPRKYDLDGAVSGGRKMSPVPVSGGFSDMKFGDVATSGGGSPTEKRKTNSLETKSSMSLGERVSFGGSFTPHMVTVNPGEDVTSKIMSFSKHGPRSICVLSALGVISHVTLRQAGSSGGTVTYEGRFEILSLTGSFTPGEVGGFLSREGGMSIALSSPDGRVVGGLLGGILTAAGPVQVVVASFLPELGRPIEPKPKKQKNIVTLSTPAAGPTTHVDQQNFNEESQESPMGGNTDSTPAPNSKHENRVPGGNSNSTPAPNFKHESRFTGGNSDSTPAPAPNFKHESRVTGGNTNSTPAPNFKHENRFMVGNTVSTPAPNFKHEGRATMPSVRDWRRAATDMNVSLRED